MRTQLFIHFVIAALPVAAQDSSWRKEIDNALVRVARRVVAAGETFSAAELPPSLVVFVTDYSVRITGTGSLQELGGKPGEVFWHSGGRIRLQNLSDQRLEIAQVVPTFSPEPSYPLEPANPPIVKFQNDLIRVRRVRPPAGRKIDERRGPTVALHLAPAHIKFTYTDGHVEEARMNAGDVRFDVAGAFTFENLGDQLDVLRIELKTSKPDRN